MGVPTAGPEWGPFFLVDRGGDRPGPRPHLSKRPILGAVVRRGLPHLVEATLIPAALFYVSLVSFGVVVAMGVALAWSYAAVGRRLLAQRRIPPILLLATVGITVRTAIALGSGSTAIYFLQPIAATVAMAGVFFLSILIGQPLVARIAADFCPLPPEVAARPAVVRLFTDLTVLWALVNLTTAAATFGLLVSLPMATFVASKLVVGLAITSTGVVLTILWSLRTARVEGLVFAGASVDRAVVQPGP
jgi:hypothetical protein